MIYVTQLIFVKEGKEEMFLEFERQAIPVMEKYNGKMLYRLRPAREDFIDLEGESPYEIHFISFDTDRDLDAFLKDDSRLKYVHLKDESVKSILLIIGEKMSR